MENQNKFLTPRVERSKKNSLLQKKNEQYDEFFQKLGAYTDVNRIPSKRPSIRIVENDEVDNDLISSIYDTPKVKIGDARVDIQKHKFQQNLLKKSIPKLNKSQQNALCQRLSSPRISKVVVDPQFKQEKPKTTYAIHEYNKGYVNSRFSDVDDMITLNQLESILKDFCIICNHVQEKPLIAQNIFPLCQINNTENFLTFDSKLLRDALIQSFSKSSESPFWKEISNCIKSSRMNRKTKSCSNEINKSIKKKVTINASSKKDENTSNNAQLSNNKNESDISYSSNTCEMVFLNQVYEKKESKNNSEINSTETQLCHDEYSRSENEEPRKLKFALITDNFSETMIDDFPCSNLVTNNQAITNCNSNNVISQQLNEIKDEKEDQQGLIENENATQNEIENEKEDNVPNEDNQNVIENEQCSSIKIQNEEENYTEVDYNSESDDQIDDENANIKGLILEIRNKSLNDQSYQKIINDSSKDIFVFSSCNSLESENKSVKNEGKKKKVIPSKIGSKKSNYPRFYDNLATLKRQENKDENSVYHTQKKSSQSIKKGLYSNSNSGKNERHS